MHSDPSYTRLPAAEGGPSLVVRHGDTILRPVQPWTPTIHALLQHLEAVGFTGAPRVVGDRYDEQGNEMLTYIDPRSAVDRGSGLQLGLKVQVSGLDPGENAGSS
jgi:hypothetical protein